MCFFWHLSGSLPPWPPTVKIVYGWNICRHWWDTLSYKPHDHMAIVIIVIGLIIRIIVSLSSSSLADPFDFSILWAFVRSALPSSRTLCQESLLEKRTVNHIIFIIIILIIIVYYINNFKSCSLSLCFFTDQRINPICVVVCNDFVSEMWSPRGWVSSKTH